MRWERNSFSLTDYLTLLGLMTLLSFHGGCHRKSASRSEIF